MSPLCSRPLRPLLLLSLSLGWCAVAVANPWPGVERPSAGPAQVIGAPANGCLAGAAALPASGVGYLDVRRWRGRYYGHPRLLALIETLGRAQQARDERLVLVGDLSQPRGGRMSGGHRSHQHGLDVDLWLTLAASPTDARALLDEGDPPSLVSGDRVNGRWGEDARFLIEWAARRPEVDRLFVNPAIKRALCDATGGAGDWLRKVRPWWGHDAHTHVRLACPEDSPACEPQSPIPAGPGCGAELDWWFSAEARSPGGGGRAVEPTPPAACARLLRAP
ncbi:penicillin-insensitive murein endopeptidase [Marichromatium gracile]|uniref:Peptidase U6 n=1 Tax=Marichromatium gracile TaxID=1048 RepID=A0ABR5VKU8_MARGR|nr:penicillin-insensitive murein endopeptidase [Marichromatium gracile]KXX66187.1 peptidase U6 [Marichromatium gracile]